MKNLINTYILGNAFDYLPKILNKSVDLFFTGIPDIDEMGNISIEEYQHFIEKALKETNRIVRDEGFAVFCQTDRKMNGTIFLKHYIILKVMLELGFIIKDYKILVKDSVDKINLYRLNYSHILIFSKNGKIPMEKRKGDYLKDLWVFELPKNKNFLPIELCNLVIKTLTQKGDFVVDPFAGRGTVLKSAKKLGRDYFGTEIKEEVYNLDFVNNV